MPIYEFKCQSCGSTTDELVKLGTTEICCSGCGETAVKTNVIHKTVSVGLPNGFCGSRAEK